MTFATANLPTYKDSGFGDYPISLSKRTNTLASRKSVYFLGLCPASYFIKQILAYNNQASFK